MGKPENISAIIPVYNEEDNVKKVLKKIIKVCNEIIIVNGDKFIVDGIDHTNKTIYEFYGDFWHGNPKIYKQSDPHPLIIGKTYGDLFKKTIYRENKLKTAGFKIIKIWENDWDDSNNNK